MDGLCHGSLTESQAMECDAVSADTKEYVLEHIAHILQGSKDLEKRVANIGM